MDQRCKQAACEGAVQEVACKRFIDATEQEVSTRVRVLRRTDSLTLLVKLPSTVEVDTAAQLQSRQASKRPCCGPAEGPFFGSKTVAGPSSTQEDSYIVIPQFLRVSSNPDKELCPTCCEFDESLHLFGIYDGHGGRIVSDFCASYLHEYLTEELSTVPSGNVRRAPSKALQDALCKSFVRVDHEVLQRQPKPGEGSTALVVLLGQHHVWTAHCGDTRAVLYRAGEPMRLTEDHRPEREDEAARVRQAGGAIVCNRGCQRVMGMLLATRSIGDFDLRAYGVIPDPELNCYSRCPEDEFMVLASDGLWDVVQCHEACGLVAKVFQRGRCKALSRRATCRVAADALMRMAQAKGSPDDITIIVVDMAPEQSSGQAGPSQQQAQQAPRTSSSTIIAQHQPADTCHLADGAARQHAAATCAAAAAATAACAAAAAAPCAAAAAATATACPVAAAACRAASLGVSALAAAVREMSLAHPLNSVDSSTDATSTCPSAGEQQGSSLGPSTAGSSGPACAALDSSSVPPSPFTSCASPISPFDFCLSPFTASPLCTSPFNQAMCAPLAGAGAGAVPALGSTPPLSGTGLCSVGGMCSDGSSGSGKTSSHCQSEEQGAAEVEQEVGGSAAGPEPCACEPGWQRCQPEQPAAHSCTGGPFAAAAGPFAAAAGPFVAAGPFASGPFSGFCQDSSSAFASAFATPWPASAPSAEAESVPAEAPAAAKADAQLCGSAAAVPDMELSRSGSAPGAERHPPPRLQLPEQSRVRSCEVPDAAWRHTALAGS